MEAKGTNISQKGIGFITEEEVVPADEIPFETIVKGYIFSNKTYSIKGIGNILYSKKINDIEAYYHNGLEFTKLDFDSQDNLFDLLEDIRKFEKSVQSNIENKTLADFNYYPSEDIFEKANIFYEAFDNLILKKYEVFSYYLEESSKSTTTFIQRKTEMKKKMVMMGSNNYLGLTTNSDVIKAGKDALDKYGSGNGSGVMVGGKLLIHKELEEALSDFTGKEAVMLFSSGYSTNLGIISGIARQNDAIINDQLNHASVFDGCKLSGAKVLVYAHNDMGSLDRILKRAKLNYNGQLIVVNGIFSSNGEIAQLDKIVEISQKYNCKIMVDEAHGLGVIGKKGIGASEYLNVLDKVDILMGTLSKSLAGVGGFAAANKEIIEYLRYYGRSYLFSTTIPASVAASVLKALEILKNDKEIREKLKYNVEYFKNGLKKLNLNIGNTEGAIVPIYIPDMNVIMNVSKMLFEKGIFHNIFSYPAVPLGGSLLRFGLMATHTEKELSYVLDSIEEASIKFNLVR